MMNISSSVLEMSLTEVVKVLEVLHESSAQ